MSVVPYKRKRQALPIPAAACVIWDCLGGSVPVTSFGVTFRLKTRRRGVEMWLVTQDVNKFSWNLSAHENVWPANFTEARAYIARYAARYGQDILEAEPDRPRMKRATGDDARLLKAGGCREAWLDSDVPALWSEAMMRCGHAGGYCGQDGHCHYGNCDMEMRPMQEVARAV